MILIVWHGVKMMFTQQTVNTPEHMFDFAKLLLFISFGYALIAFYESPIPGIGVSFSNLITDQAANFANILDARSLEMTFDHLDELWDRFLQPDTWRFCPTCCTGWCSSSSAWRRPPRLWRSLRHDRHRRLRLAWPDLRPLSDRAALRVHVLGLAESLHPVRVYSGRGRSPI